MLDVVAKNVFHPIQLEGCLSRRTVPKAFIVIVILLHVSGSQQLLNNQKSVHNDGVQYSYVPIQCQLCIVSKACLPKVVVSM